ncbi:hypothetical protein LR48_Vigan632s000300 [Vigna angularis]|uniref:Uncharacterized protein n=1 Tax=Phaseolus angularis TaxID=3914 RepID=A0A0L9TER6_PHAAN|nr:hypothetical protein LR48_Vigan632s000300 [Vigna angularis]
MTLESLPSTILHSLMHIKFDGPRQPHHRDVVMDEAESWNWTTKVNGSKQNVSIIFKDEEERLGDESNGNRQIDDEVQNTQPQPQRALRQRNMPRLLVDFEVFSDSVVTDEGDLVHYC